MRGALAAMLVLGTTAVSAAEPLLLRMKYAKGQTRRYRVFSTVSLETPGVPSSGPIAATLELAVRVLSVDGAGAADVIATLERFSAEPSRLFRVPALTPFSCRGRMDARGAFAPAADGCDATSRRGQALLGALGELRPLLPERPVAPGATWRAPVRMTLPAMAGQPPARTLRGDMTLSVREYKTIAGRRCALVPMTAALNGELPVLAEPRRPGMPQGHVEIRVRVSGEGCFDLSLGDWATLTRTEDRELFFTGNRHGQGRGVTTTEMTRLPDREPERK